MEVDNFFFHSFTEVKGQHLFAVQMSFTKIRPKKVVVTSLLDNEKKVVHLTMKKSCSFDNEKKVVITLSFENKKNVVTSEIILI